MVWKLVRIYLKKELYFVELVWRGMGGEENWFYFLKINRQTLGKFKVGIQPPKENGKISWEINMRLKEVLVPHIFYLFIFIFQVSFLHFFDSLIQSGSKLKKTPGNRTLKLPFPIINYPYLLYFCPISFTPVSYL